MVMSVQGCGERETRGISQTHLGSDWDIHESLGKMEEQNKHTCR